MPKGLNLQDAFLNGMRKEGTAVQIYLLNAVQLRGTVRGFDAFTILLDAPGKPTQLVYKHAVASIVPTGFPRAEASEDEAAPAEATETPA